MSHDRRADYYRDRDRQLRDHHGRDWDRDRDNYRNMGRHGPRKRSRSRSRDDKRRSRSPRKSDKDILDDNILNEISKLPESNELWDSQFTKGSTFTAPPPPNLFQEGVPNSTYNPHGSYQHSYTGLYDDFPSVSSMSGVPPEVGSWNQMSLPPPPHAQPQPTFQHVEDQIKKEAAIETEMRHQKAALSKQREDYIKKSGILKKELDTLKDQRNELRGDSKRSPSPDTKRFLKENTKLQLEIQNKLKTITNVVEMLNEIIGEEAQEKHEPVDEVERSTRRKSRSPSSSRKFNYVYYDPEMHWCRVCNEFPSTAKDYLNHLHSPSHHKMAAAHMEAPWHSVSGLNDGFPNYPAAPTKRTPIKGLQFFVPSTAWYCKLCDQFIGDLHCASAHLKSVGHSKNYTNFVEQNPHWETDWMSDRQKAIEKSRTPKGKIEEKPQYTPHTISFDKDGFHHTKSKESPSPTNHKKKDRKKKKKHRKHSSTSYSDVSSDSDTKKKKKKKGSESHEKNHSSWTDDRLSESDRKLLDTIKHRTKKDQEVKYKSPPRRSRERERSESIHRKIRELERRENERRDEVRRAPSPAVDNRKPETKKMPFIGKMPVYKSLTKPKVDEQKKEDQQKKKEEEETVKKRREELDAEIQKKVAEFKEKIAKAQFEKQQQMGAELRVVPPYGAGLLPPPIMTNPPQTIVATSQPPPVAPTPAVPQPALPKDFQEALDIIFPSDVKQADMSQQDMFSMSGMAGGFPLMHFPVGIMPHQVGGVYPFDVNSSLFRQQLYDSHVPIVPQNQKGRPNNRKNNERNNNSKRNNHQLNQKQSYLQNQKQSTQNNKNNSNNTAARKKEELDELAMLGIDASDVGAGM